MRASAAASENAARREQFCSGNEVAGNGRSPALREPGFLILSVRELVASAATAAAATIAAAAATTAATATVTAASAAAAFGLGPRFVHGQRPALHLSPVEGLDGGLRLLIAAHFHETESLGSARVAVHDHLRRLHGAMRLEQTLQFPVTNAVG